MMMRKKPKRGEEYVADGVKVIVIEVLNDGKGDRVSVVLPSGRLSAVPKAVLDLPVIDTRDYERLAIPRRKIPV